jgi:predicted 3-demethylubiquinone-9 3-methyltransferase (glyoxalase superfamily)
MQTIVPSLWFDDEAEDAARFWVSVFSSERRPGARNGESTIGEISRYGEAGPREAGMVLTVSFRLDGQEFTALNGGPDFSFTEAISLLVSCESQEEVDYFWDALGDGGEPGQCGWLKDRYGLSWQIVPTELAGLLGDPDPGRSQRAMKAMLEMRKLDVAGIRRAADAA